MLSQGIAIGKIFVAIDSDFATSPFICEVRTFVISGPCLSPRRVDRAKYGTLCQNWMSRFEIIENDSANRKPRIKESIFKLKASQFVRSRCISYAISYCACQAASIELR
jgi:hypothetical protein